MNKLVQLYQEMYEHTKGECANSCRVPHSCCDSFSCLLTAEFAKQQGIVLEPTDHPNLPFMSPNGCIVAPHLRPHCTLHTCAVNGLGFKPNDQAWTKRYFQIRRKIDRVELKQITAAGAGSQ